MCCGGINDPYFIISRARSHENKDDFVRIFKSDVKLNNPNPIWNPIKVKMAHLCNADPELPIRFEVYSQMEDGKD
jgi:hypothetical protein